MLTCELDLAERLYQQARVLHETVEMQISELTDLTALFLLRFQQGRAGELLPVLSGPALGTRREHSLLIVSATLQSGDLTGARRLSRHTRVFDPVPRW